MKLEKALIVADDVYIDIWPDGDHVFYVFGDGVSFNKNDLAKVKLVIKALRRLAKHVERTRNLLKEQP